MFIIITVSQASEGDFDTKHVFYYFCIDSEEKQSTSFPGPLRTVCSACMYASEFSTGPDLNPRPLDKLFALKYTLRVDPNIHEKNMDFLRRRARVLMFFTKSIHQKSTFFCVSFQIILIRVEKLIVGSIQRQNETSISKLEVASFICLLLVINYF